MKKLILLSLFVLTIKVSFGALSIDVTSTNNPLCNGSSDGEITISIAGDNAPFVIDWPSSQSTNNIQGDYTETGFADGIYCITLTDDIGATASACVIIYEPDMLMCNISSPGNPSCFGASDGYATVYIEGGSYNVDIDWSDGTSNDQINYPDTKHTAVDLPNGEVSVTITDANGCTASAMADLLEPAEVTITITSAYDPTCYGMCDGGATATFSGGTSLYDITWNNGGGDDILDISATSASAYNLCANQLYTAMVTDNNGCTSSTSITLSEPTLLTVTASGINLLCYGSNNGMANAIASGGTGAYSYMWDNGYTDASISNLTEGTYQIICADENGCSASDEITLIEPAEITIETGYLYSTCQQADGSAFITSVSNNAGMYDAQWDNGVSGDVNEYIPQGAYTVTVTDANACTASAIQPVEDAPAPSSSVISEVGESCYGSCDGYGEIIIIDGVPPYTLSVGGVEIASNVLAGESFYYYDMCAGSEYIIAQDAAGCSIYTNVYTSSTDELFISMSFTDETSSGATDGTATASGSGGTGTLTYLWNNMETTATIIGLTPGEYCCTITDDNGCMISSCSNVEVSTGINELSANTIISASGTHVSINASKGHVEVYNLTGKRMYKGNLNASRNTISLKKGIYLVRANSNGKQYTRKVYLSGN
ncbi:MAG: T9SS type A sorting domain-containing protein [Flavobacteriales bacterium]|nr:T9SS type A sorting domain-containing protein [Flavobacteriales bacterium]